MYLCVVKCIPLIGMFQKRNKFLGTVIFPVDRNINDKNNEILPVVSEDYA